MIEGVILTHNKVVELDKGNVLHGIKRTDETFKGFGEVYFSKVAQGAIKGWKKHTRMWMNLVVPVGEVQFVIYDDREESSTYQQRLSVNLSEQNYYRLTVPPGVWVAFKGIGSQENMLMNMSDITHDPDESINQALENLPFERE